MTTYSYTAPPPPDPPGSTSARRVSALLDDFTDADLRSFVGALMASAPVQVGEAVCAYWETNIEMRRT